MTEMKNKNNVLYENYKMFSPDGQLMCRIGKKKVCWYLNKDLAYIPEGDPNSIVLKFKPAGLGKANKPCELAYKKNICVVCGEKDTTKLTRHHVVPYCFRKHFEIENKEHKDYDIVLLCKECHHTYESEAYKIKEEMAKEYTRNILGDLDYDFMKIAKINRKASALIKYKKQIPRIRRKEILNDIRKFLKKERVTVNDIKKVATMNADKDRKEWSFCIVEKCEDIQSFIVRWRKHFLNTMEPKFLPDFWDEFYF